MQGFMLLLHQLTFSSSKTPFFALLSALSHVKYYLLGQRSDFRAFGKPQPDYREAGF